jgi:hypothetical protein
MSAALAPEIPASVNRREATRHALAVPVDITVLRSGIPYSIPGRSFDVGKGGIGVAVASELCPGTSVGIRFRMIASVESVMLKAVVRHYGRLSCGLQFVGLSLDQGARIETWASRMCSEVIAPNPAAQCRSTQSTVSAKAGPIPSAHKKLSLWPLCAALAISFAVGGVGWWRWYRAWHELESTAASKDSRALQPRANVPAETMEALLVHRTDPIYPEAARQAHVQGIVVLRAIIGIDGTVADLTPISGPDVLLPAAEDAVRWWRFQPYQLSGKPVPVETTLALDFREN